MRPRGSADGGRSRLQECEPAHVVAQVAQPDPGGCASLPDAPHPRPFHLVDHAAEHVFGAHTDPGAQAADVLLMRRQRAVAVALIVGRASSAPPPGSVNGRHCRPIPGHRPYPGAGPW